MAVVEEHVMAPDDLTPMMEDYISEGRYDTEAGPIEGLPPIDPKDAPKIARRRARIGARIAKTTAWFDGEIARLQMERDAILRPMHNEAERCDTALANILVALRATDPSWKTLDLPHGVTVKARRVPAAFKRDAEAAANAMLLAFLATRSPYVETKHSVRWAELKPVLRLSTDGQIVTTDGEIVPPECGITYEPEHESVTVKVSTEGTDA